MPELQLAGGVARSLCLTDYVRGESISFVLTACAPVDIEKQAQQWYRDNPTTNPYDLVKWMQGKNWGVINHDTPVDLQR